MAKVTKSAKNNIEVLSANGLSSFVDDTDGLLKLKDVNGVVEPITNYTGNVNGEVIVQDTGTCSSVRCGVNNTASGDYSGAFGGSNNKATGLYANVVGGFNNCATGVYSSVVGGMNNCATGNYSFVGGGAGNIACATCSAVVGGTLNNALGIYSFVGGGVANCARNVSSSVLGGSTNTAGGVGSVVGGGILNVASQGAILGGCCNISSGSGNSSAVLGGVSNLATGQGSVVVGGIGNCSTAQCSFVGGGRFNSVNATASSIVGGCCNLLTTASQFSSILGGQSNCGLNGCYQIILGGILNRVVGFSGATNCASNYSQILNGCCNRVTSIANSRSCFSTIINGFNNQAQGAYNTILNGNNNCAIGSYNNIVYDNNSIIGNTNNVFGYSICGNNISTSNIFGGSTILCNSSDIFTTGINGNITGMRCSFSLGFANNCLGITTCNNIISAQNNAQNSIAFGSYNCIIGQYGLVDCFFGGFYPLLCSNRILGDYNCILSCQSYGDNTTCCSYNQQFINQNFISGQYNNITLKSEGCKTIDGITPCYYTQACSYSNYITSSNNSCIVSCTNNNNSTQSCYYNAGIIVSINNKIQGGDNHKILLNNISPIGEVVTRMDSSFIGNGSGNTLSALSCESAYESVTFQANGILSGVGNSICIYSQPSQTASGYYRGGTIISQNLILGGCNNQLGGTTPPCSESFTNQNIIINGQNNLILNTTCGSCAIPFQSCFGGSNNTIANGRSNCIVNVNLGFIGNGELNRICKGGVGECGLGSSIINGCCNCISGSSATMAGGTNNRITTFEYGFVGGGANNNIGGSFYNGTILSAASTMSGGYSIIGGGLQNISSSCFTFTGNGCGNNASSFYSSILNGCLNNVGGCFSSVLGGCSNKSTGIYTSVLGGLSNCATGCYSLLGGGVSNTASGSFGIVSGGCGNRSIGAYSSVLNGFSNCATASYASVFAGQNNLASCIHSYIAGVGITARMTCALHVNRMVMTNVPTSSAGLPSGAIWSNAGVLSIVP